MLSRKGARTAWISMSRPWMRGFQMNGFLEFVEVSQVYFEQAVMSNGHGDLLEPAL